MLKRTEIAIRDPYILTAPDGSMYLYGTTNGGSPLGAKSCICGYKTDDLENYSDRVLLFEANDDFWANKDFWAAEVHFYKDKYYMFASFKADNRCRASQILVSDTPLGKFVPLTDSPITPMDWECLDATLYIEDGIPYTIFCKEWVQVRDGEMYAQRLSDDLKQPVGEPKYLFKASDAKWSKGFDNGVHKENYVTDGPFIYKLKSGKLAMLWSTVGHEGYAMGVAYADSIMGEWTQHDEPLYKKDGGHGMVFEYDNRLYMSLHSPNGPLNAERPHFFEIEESGNNLKVK